MYCNREPQNTLESCVHDGLGEVSFAEKKAAIVKAKLGAPTKSGTYYIARFEYSVRFEDLSIRQGEVTYAGTWVSGPKAGERIPGIMTTGQEVFGPPGERQRPATQKGAAGKAKLGAPSRSGTYYTGENRLYQAMLARRGATARRYAAQTRSYAQKRRRAKRKVFAGKRPVSRNLPQAPSAGSTKTKLPLAAIIAGVVGVGLLIT